MTSTSSTPSLVVVPRGPHDIETNNNITQHSVLVAGGKLLTGDALRDYAQQKGLCSKCVQQVTHKRVRKKVSMLRYVYEYEPLTKIDEIEGNYTVYKGYCLQPTCWTLSEVQEILGETRVPKPSRSKHRRKERSLSRCRQGNTTNGDNSSTTSCSTSNAAAVNPERPQQQPHGLPAREKSLRSLSRRMAAATPTSGDNATNSSGLRSGSRRQLLLDAAAQTAASNASSERQPSSTDEQNHNEHAPRGLTRSRSQPRKQWMNETRALTRSSSSKSCSNLSYNTSSRNLMEYDPTATSISRTTPGRSNSFNESNHSKNGTKDDGMQTLLSRSNSCSRSLGAEIGQPSSRASTLQSSSSQSSRSFNPPSSYRSTTNDNNNSANPSSSISLDLEARRRNLRNSGMGQIEPNLQKPSSRSKKTSSAHASSGEETTKEASRIVRKPVPTSAILQQLLHPPTNPLAPPSALWSSLQKRYGRDSVNVETQRGKVSLLLYIKEAYENDETENATAIVADVWKLMAALTHTQCFHDSWSDEEDLVQGILFHIGYELDREKNTIETKKLAVRVLFQILEAGDPIPALETLSSRLRQHWIAICLDMLLLTDQSSTNVTEVLFVIWNLLLTKPEEANPMTMSAEELLHRKTIVSMIVSILSPQSSFHHSENIYGGGSFHSAADSVFSLAESALGLLATASSEQGYQVLADRQAECLAVVCNVLQKYGDSSLGIMVQGAQCIRNILASRCVDDNERSCYSCYGKSKEIIDITVTMLLNEEREMVLVQDACEILVNILSNDFSARTLLRQKTDVATTIVNCINLYESSAYIQENLCVVLYQLISLEDHTFGGEVGEAGGLQAIIDLLSQPRPVTRGSLFEAALRALIGILSSADMDKLLFQHEDAVALCESVVSILDSNRPLLQVQMAALEVLNCMCTRSNHLNKLLTFSVPVIADVMDYHMVNEEILARSCSVLRFIATTCEDWGYFVESGVVQLMTAAIMSHPEQTELVLETMTTIISLAAEPSFRQYLDILAVEETIVCVIQVNMHNSEVLKYAFRALNNVVVDFGNHSIVPVQRSTLSYLVSALEIHGDDPGLVRSACQLLKSYTYEKSSMEKMELLSDTLIPLLSCHVDSSCPETRDRVRIITRKLCGDSRTVLDDPRQSHQRYSFPETSLPIGYDS